MSSIIRLDPFQTIVGVHWKEKALVVIDKVFQMSVSRSGTPGTFTRPKCGGGTVTIDNTWQRNESINHQFISGPIYDCNQWDITLIGETSGTRWPTVAKSRSSLGWPNCATDDCFIELVDGAEKIVWSSTSDLIVFQLWNLADTGFVNNEWIDAEIVAPPVFDIVSITRAAPRVRVECAQDHGFFSGGGVTISETSKYNGNKLITGIVDSKTFDMSALYFTDEFSGKCTAYYDI